MINIFYKKNTNTANRSSQSGYLGLLAILVTAIVAVLIFSTYFEKDSETQKSAADTNREALDAAKQIQIQSQLKANETNMLMEEGIR